MGQSIFEASKKVKAFILNGINPNTVVQKSGVVAIQFDDILVFHSVDQAIRNAPDAYIFSYIYRNGDVELIPES